MKKVPMEVPIRGKMIDIIEKSVTSRGLFYENKYLQILLVLDEEFLKRLTAISLIRDGETGSVLGGLIEDFKNGKKLYCEGKVAYWCVKPTSLPDTINWDKVMSENTKNALKELVDIRPPLTMDITVQVDDKPKYKIILLKNRYHSSPEIHLVQ